MLERVRLLFLLAMIAPPLAVLAVARRPRPVVISFGLTLLLWLPGSIHALALVYDWAERTRGDQLAECLCGNADRW